jgi:predicted HTH transcriptional regulator
MPEWTQSTIRKLIDDKIQESLTLEYKAAGAVSRSPRAMTEITKDVSAMANSAGGTIVYGVAEYSEADKKHLPEKIDPVDQTQFSREWLAACRS